jgi:hypothetical protein
MDAPVSNDQRFGRELEEDHDLLTFNESAARLREEIERARAQLAELSRLPVTDENAKRATQVSRRLAQLEVSEQRNSRQAAQSPGVRGFLDYRPGSSSLK